MIDEDGPILGMRSQCAKGLGNNSSLSLLAVVEACKGLVED
jgi:hypothetical protein